VDSWAFAPLGFLRKGVGMKTFIGASVVCLCLMLTGIARAGYNGSDYCGKNKSYDLPYFLCSQDLSNHDCTNQDGGNHNHGDGGSVLLPGNCQPPGDTDGDHNPGGGCDNGGYSDKGGCDNGGGGDKGGCGDNGGKGCHGGDGDNPPSVVVPLPASSALGGVGIVIASVYGWLRSRRAAA